MQRGLIPLLLCFIGSTPVAAQDSLEELLQGFDSGEKASAGDVDALLEGFEDSTPDVIETKPDSSSLDWLSFGGYMSLSESINYQHQAPAQGQADFRGLSRLRYKLLPEVEVELPKRWKIFISGNAFFDGAFYANGREQYRDSYLDEYEKEIELRELWLRGSIGSSLDIKFGRQILAWGKSDSIRVVDGLNPLDMREPGMVDLEDLRLPVTMARADYFIGDWSMTAVVIPELRTNKIPVEGSDFYPIPFSMPSEDAPENWKNPEFAFALSGVFNGWDMSLHAASTYEDQAHFEQAGNGMQRVYSRINMIGIAENMVFGSWLLKMEYAVFEGLKYFTSGDKTFMRGDLMAGLDYTGITNHTVSVEGLWTRIFEYDTRLQNAPDDTGENNGQLAIRYTGNFMHETLQLVALASIFGFDGSDGAFYRASAKYIPQDAFSVTAGIMVYQSGDSLFLDAIARNDRLFAEVRYDF